VECAACHTAQTPAAETPTQCAACHAEPLNHRGVFSEPDCATCHTPQAWSPVLLNGQTNFSHTQTDFQLIHHLTDYAGVPITCTVCHTNASRSDFSLATTTCLACHSAHDANFMTAHVENYGPNCLSCHDGTGNMTNFDHSQVFALEGRHAALECMACHQEQTFRGTPRECVACHAEPQIHAGVFGTQCEACHTATAWAPAHLTRHAFPLNHGEAGEIACATCHAQSYATYTCTACHAQNEMEEHHAEKGITGEQVLACTQCHLNGRNPGDE
jgi:predicted CXXCH cytochrome family protein